MSGNIRLELEPDLAGAGARAGAKIRGKVEPELEPKLNNFDSATLEDTMLFCQGKIFI